MAASTVATNSITLGMERRVCSSRAAFLTPVEAPIVIVVTGEEGGQYGYDDSWDADGVFHYYGAGQVGPMEFARGNLALRDHSENGEEVHLFEQVSGGLRYDGEMVCAGYYERDDVPDRNGDLRGACTFEGDAIEALYALAFAP